MHNLGTVIRFEVFRTLKKKSFWLAALAIPLIAGIVGLIIFFSNKTTNDIGKELNSEHYSLGITDESKLISPSLVASFGAQEIPSKEAGEEEVRTGKIDAYFYYPQDISKQAVETYGKDVGFFKNGRYEGVARTLLTQSVAASTTVNIRAVLQNTTPFKQTTYKDGQIDKGILKAIAPGVFLILFYFMIAGFSSQMLTSVIEEKENRVIEMILTTIKPTTLLVGKLFALVLLALIQICIVIIPVIAGYLLFKDQLSLPNFDLSLIPLDPLSITLGVVIFMVSFLMYTGILMTIGAAMPTAKEANSFFGAAIAFTFAPLYAAPLFISSPDSPLVQVLSYFPLTSPLPLLLRNAAGNLSLNEALIGIALLILTTTIAIRIGVRIFKYGALEYSRKLSAKEVFGIGRKS
jgi:ABC-2 type transport system permease protein